MRDDLGTTRWFGPTWNSPINNPRTQIKEPVDVDCDYCQKRIQPGQRGVRIPYVGGENLYSYFHMLCLMIHICGAGPARMATEVHPELAEEPWPQDHWS